MKLPKKHLSIHKAVHKYLMGTTASSEDIDDIRYDAVMQYLVTHPRYIYHGEVGPGIKKEDEVIWMVREYKFGYPIQKIELYIQLGQNMFETGWVMSLMGVGSRIADIDRTDDELLMIDRVFDSREEAVKAVESTYSLNLESDSLPNEHTDDDDGTWTDPAGGIHYEGDDPAAMYE